MAAKIRKGDKVVVLTGRDKGRTGEVIEVRPADDRALVRGINMVKRHQKQTAQQEGGIVSKELSVHLSNLALADPKDGKPTRVGFKSLARARTARRSASPSVRELRSMAEEDPKTARPRSRRRRSTSRRRPRPAPRRPRLRRTRLPRRRRPRAGDKKPREPEERVTPRLRTQFDEVIRKALIEQFGYKNPMQVPRVDKIVLNMGVGEGVADRKKVEQAAEALAAIAGQKAVITHSRKSIATYKLRDGQPIGCKVTLRKTRMYEFLDRLVNIALPRVRDFRGLNPKSFDGRGNYSIGIKEHIIFPEIDYDKVDDVWGMDIIVCTTATHRRRGARVADRFQFPVPAVRAEGPSNADSQETV